MSSRMQDQKEKPKLSARDVIAPLVIGTLGAVVAIAAYFVVPGFLEIEVVLLLVIVLGAAIGYNRRTLRGFVTIPFLYVALAVSATAYEAAAPYIGAPFGDFREVEPTRMIKALSFFVMMLVIWIPLEGISGALFKDMSLPSMGFLDNLGGILIHVFIGIWIAALIFNGMGYIQRWSGPISDARMAPLFLGTVRLHYLAQSVWFPTRVPPIYRGALQLLESLGE